MFTVDALQLTLCELATANIPIPPICRKAAHDSETDPDGCIRYDFIVAPELQWKPFYTYMKTYSQLANIPQTWTSYSGKGTCILAFVNEHLLLTIWSVQDTLETQN